MATILIATIDTTEFDILAAEIEGEGHEVINATDGKDAIDLTLARQPAIVILDAALPVFDGFAVAGLLRNDPDVPRELPLVLLGDEPVEPHVFERSGFTTQFPKDHSHHEVRELLSRYINTPLTPP